MPGSNLESGLRCPLRGHPSRGPSASVPDVCLSPIEIPDGMNFDPVNYVKET